MKICQRCKKEYDDSWKVCLHCGAALEDGLQTRLAYLEAEARKMLAEIDAIRSGKPVTAGAGAEEPQAVPRPASKEDTETRIGKYLLNKIGIISVVAGMSFFLAYAFKYLSPLWKICIGYAISAAMAAGGMMTERLERYKWYGRGLICGGWVLAYFTTYAMYHIKATRIIENQFHDLMLVSIVVIAMLMHLVRYRSQGLVILAMLLGYATAGISQYASFAFLYITILAAVSGVLLVGMNWQTVAVFSLLGTYLTHLLWLRPYQAIPPDRAEFWVNAGFLAAYWTIYNGVSLFVKTYDEREKNWSAAFALANSLLFGVICFMQVRAYNAAWKVPFALASAAILLAFGAVSASAKDKPHVRSAFFVAAIAFATVSVRFTAGKTAAYFIWLMEIPVLLAAGFYLKSVFYRFGAWVLSLIMLLGMLVSFGIPDERVIYRGKEMPLVLFLYLTAITCFYLARYVYIARPALSKCHENELRFSNLYTVLASAALLGVSYYEIQTKLVTLTWSASALFLFMIGFFAKDKIFRYSAIGVVAVSLLRGVTVDLAGINTAYRIILFICLGLVLLGVSFWYAKASAAAEGGKAAGGAGMRWAALAIMPLVAASVLAAAYRYPSDFRKMGEMNAKEAEITARFMAGKDLSADDTAFLRERKFRSLEQTLRGLPLGKDGARLEIHLHAVAMGLESMDVYRKLGRYYAEIDKKDKALEMYEKGIALDPQAKQWETRDMVRQAAKLSKDTGDYRKAAAYYERYLTFSKNVLDLYELAVCYKNLGDLDKALEKLNEAVRMDQRGMYSSELNSLKSDIYGRKKVLEEKASPKKSPARK